ncbi:uncharacterized protein LODBEIA_P51730 [Lodderomyces beijingensis]|uniref:Nuclear rim protein 1 n=1 Tax=Lodderomyces beijingensis TaxID=1775926 RepID=A0ABP0ZS25_9ASCO
MAPKRLVRKQSVITKIKAFPFDFYLYLNEIRLSIDWDDYAPTLGLPFGISAIAASVLTQSVLHYYTSINSRSKNALFKSNHVQYESIKNSLVPFDKNVGIKARRFPDFQNDLPTTTTFVWTLNVLQGVIILLSIVNTIWIFTGSRSYQLLYCKHKPKYKSAVHPASQESFLFVTIYFLFKLFSSQSESEGEDEEDAAQDANGTTELNDEEYWELKVWQPSKFCLSIFVGLNPISSYISYNYTSKCSSLSIIILIAMISALNYKLIDSFLNLIDDKQIVYSEMFSEFNNKYVKPKTNILKKDASVDATQGPDSLSSVLVNRKPYTFTKSRAFTTHDAKGHAVTEYVEPPADGENLGQGQGQQASFLPPSPSRVPDPRTSRLSSRFPSRRSSVFNHEPNYSVPPSYPFHPQHHDNHHHYRSSTPYENANIHPDLMRSGPFPRLPQSSEGTTFYPYNNYPARESPSHRCNYSARNSPQRLSPMRPNLEYDRRGSADLYDQHIYHEPSGMRSPSPERSPIYYRSPSPRRPPDFSKQQPPPPGAPR